MKRYLDMQLNFLVGILIKKKGWIDYPTKSQKFLIGHINSLDHHFRLLKDYLLFKNYLY